ncbi:MAG: hypothetical protein JO280_18785 [Mycobacteriaceae bacterium]|nr:hypothetical protein [Mycobacteriaceae bacterium]
MNMLPDVGLGMFCVGEAGAAGGAVVVGAVVVVVVVVDGALSVLDPHAVVIPPTAMNATATATPAR